MLADSKLRPRASNRILFPGNIFPHFFLTGGGTVLPNPVRTVYQHFDGDGDGALTRSELIQDRIKPFRNYDIIK